MANTNTVIITGNMTADPELKKVGGDDIPVVNFSIAVNGRKDDEVSFFRISAWRGLAENIAAYKVKGDKVTVTGSLMQQRFEKDGQKRESVQIVAKDVEFHSKASGDSAASNGQTGAGKAKADDDDIPF